MNDKVAAAPCRAKQVETEIKRLSDEVETLAGFVNGLDESLSGVLVKEPPDDDTASDLCQLEICECAEAIRSNRQVIGALGRRLSSFLDRLQV